EDVELRKKLRSIDRLNTKIKCKSRKSYQPRKIGFYEDMSPSRTSYRIDRRTKRD
uniref:Transposase n=1 Tax=Rhabditophanes sp. KR3021 TaxID=114890 RepID=A0AC35TYD3_9BILA